MNTLQNELSFTLQRPNILKQNIKINCLRYFCAKLDQLKPSNFSFSSVTAADACTASSSIALLINTTKK